MSIRNATATCANAGVPASEGRARRGAQHEVNGAVIAVVAEERKAMRQHIDKMPRSPHCAAH
jgi:hypothetical protein